MISFSTPKSDEDLLQILELQKSNLPRNLTITEKAKEGFVTVCHSLEDLRKLNDREQHLVMKDKEKIVGYLLAMTKHSRNDIPVLVPMFEMFDKIAHRQKPVSTYNYIVVGQVCIHKSYRGTGLLDQSYLEYKKSFKDKYDFAITEVAVNNVRSINAHKRVGFREVKRYIDSPNTEWSIILWDWT